MADLSRRNFLKLSLGTVAVAAVLPACKSGPKELNCTDTSAIAPSDAQMRQALGYVDKSTNPAQKCTNCVQFIPAAPDNCGACKLVKGPINPEGYCKSWTAKPA